MPPIPARSGAPAWSASGVRPAAVAAVVLFVVALTLGRPDVGLLGVPALLSVVFSRTRPPDAPSTIVEEPAPQGGAGTIASAVRIAGGELAHVRASAAGHRRAEVVVRLPRAGRRLGLRLASVRTGPQATALADARGYDGVWEHAVSTVGGSARLVLPTSAPLSRVPLPRRLRGLTGPRPSRRFGDGSELRDVHPFVPGDRLKRIDWRTTARRSPDLDTLYVRRVFADAEAVVVLVVDSRDDVGPDVRAWGAFRDQRVDEPTSLDLARHAAASVAHALVRDGDRVGLVDLAREARPLPPASGRRHLRRLLHGLALAHPVGQPRPTVRPPQVPGDAFIYLFSTVLDEAAAKLARTWRGLGHPVVVVDTLPDVRPVSDPRVAIAWRIVRLERQLRLDGLAREGIPVVRWASGAGAAAELDALARTAGRDRR